MSHFWVAQVSTKFILEAHKTRSSGQNGFQTEFKSKDDQGVRDFWYTTDNVKRGRDTLMSRPNTGSQGMLWLGTLCDITKSSCQSVGVPHILDKSNKTKQQKFSNKLRMKLAWNGTLKLERQLPPEFLFSRIKHDLCWELLQFTKKIDTNNCSHLSLLPLQSFYCLHKVSLHRYGCKRWPNRQRHRPGGSNSPSD